MTNIAERVNTPIADAELLRRWGAIRTAMDNHGIDVLIASANNDYMGGYVKYLTDEPAVMGYRMSVVFPKTGDISILRHGPAMDAEQVNPGGTEVWRGPGYLYRAPSFATVPHTNEYEADVLVEMLGKPTPVLRIGLLGLNQFSASTVMAIQARLDKAEFVDFSPHVDSIKSIKSNVEQRFISRTAGIQDLVMQEIAQSIRPGVRESDITAQARLLSEKLGSEQGTYMCGSSVPGGHRHIATRHYQNRVLQKGDIFYLLLEANGPGGYYAQLGRTFMLGKVPSAIASEYAFTVEAQELTQSLLIPGASSREIWEQYNAFHRRRQRTNDEECRLHCHGQGYDIVEAPLVRWDEEREIRSGMYVASHPLHQRNGVYSWLSENFLIGDMGVGKSIHAFSRDILEL